MKKTVYIFLFFLYIEISFSQNTPDPCPISGSEQTLFKQTTVLEQWVFHTDKKTKKKSFISVYEYDENGCMVKQIVPDASSSGTYIVHEWKYDDKGRMTGYKEGKISADSSKTFAFGESYTYNSAGQVNSYRKDVYESDMSQTVDKWEYSYSEKGEKTGSSFSKLRVRKDTILNDDIKYSATGTPVERTINTYFPKGLSDFRKYNSLGLPAEYIRYEKGKMTSHKTYAYKYNALGALELETITDGIAKTSEKKKYEKDKITYTMINTKGKVLKNTTEPLFQPVALPYPAIPSPAPMQVTMKNEPAVSYTKKEKTDKKKNRIVENYSGGKIVFTETFNPQGLLMEKNTAIAGFVMVYEYTFY